MNTSNLDTHRDARFDAAMRDLHRSAVASVTPQLRWKLRPAPTGGAAGRFGGRGFGDWRVGTGLAAVTAAVFAVAIGFGLRAPDDAASPTSTLAANDPATETVGVLEQDPDFFAWLASDDAALVAVE